MTQIFDGLAGVLNDTFGAPVRYWDATGVVRTIQAVFRYVPSEIYGDDDVPSIVDQPVLQVPHTLASRIARGVEVDVNGSRYQVVNRQPTQASPAADAFVTFQLEPMA